ncbi:MAG: PHP domain-containing protein [Thermoplasmata archaeon]
MESAAVPAEVADRVQFDKPPLDRLAARGFRAVDMHFHTKHSDAYTRVPSALGLARKKGVGLAITDHNTPAGVVQASRIDPTAFLVPGMEVSARDGPHVLLYFYGVTELVDFYEREVEPHKGKSPYLATDLSTIDLLERTQGYNCVRAAAHPYGYLVFNKGVAKSVAEGYLTEHALSRFEALEVINGSMTRTLNRRALSLSTRENLGAVGGTDGHILRDLGSVVTYAEADSVEDFLDAVVHGRSSVVGHEKNVLDKLATATLLMTRFVPYLAPSLVIHYRQNAPRLRRFLRRKARGGSRTQTKVK